jgi:hypothetical protein
MQEAKDEQTKSALRHEIEALQNYYKTLSDYVAGKECDVAEIAGTFQFFKEGLGRVSAHILTVYVLKGQKTKITWEPLLVNVDNALENMRATVHPNPRAAIQLAFTMSEPNAQEVMAYLAKLKATL